MERVNKEISMIMPVLSAEDRLDIIENRWLSDDVIDGAMTLIKNTMPEIGALHACGAVMYMSPLAAPVPG